MKDYIRISRAIEFAVKYHDGQFRADKVTPYSVHPLAVMNLLTVWGEDVTMCCVGAGHDLYEDCPHLRAEIEKQVHTFLGDEVHDLIFELTRVEGEEYEEYVFRLSARALRIKVADAYCNLFDSARTFGIP
jgi:(p)ppGpp synthase/HD superfamily hydrolase